MKKIKKLIKTVDFSVDYQYDYCIDHIYEWSLTKDIIEFHRPTKTIALDKMQEILAEEGLARIDLIEYTISYKRIFLEPEKRDLYEIGPWKRLSAKNAEAQIAQLNEDLKAKGIFGWFKRIAARYHLKDLNSMKETLDITPVKIEYYLNIYYN